MEDLLTTTTELALEGNVMTSGMPKPLHLALFVSRFRREVRAPFPPAWMVRVLMSPLAAIARMRGHHERYALAASNRTANRRHADPAARHHRRAVRIQRIVGQPRDVAGRKHLRREEARRLAVAVRVVAPVPAVVVAHRDVQVQLRAGARHRHVQQAPLLVDRLGGRSRILAGNSRRSR